MDSQSITKKKRDANIELLRIVAMLMIITLQPSPWPSSVMVMVENAISVANTEQNLPQR